ncbi:MAG TPA: tetratricopeptide repeat protein [Anaerolineae bacterium]|nr:tetratricopeptide repeat protein [Anaerolineae bacterium]
MSDLQTLENNLTQAQTTVDRINALNDLAWELTRDDASRSKKLAEEAMNLSQSGEFQHDHYQRGLGLGLRTIARINSFEGHYQTALTQAQQSLNIFRQIDEPQHIPYVLNTLSSVQRSLGDVSAALELAFEQLRISETLGDQHGYAMALISIGISYIDQNDYEQTLDYFERALKVFRELKDTYWIALVLNNISYVEFQQGNHDKSVDRGLESLAIAQSFNHRRIELSIYNSLAETYLAMGEYEQALNNLDQGVTLAREAKYTEDEADALKIIGQVHEQKGDLAQAETHYQQALSLFEQIGHKQFTYQLHQILAKLYRQLGQFERALTHYEQFHTLKEQVFNEESNRKMKDLEVMHHTETARQEAAYYAALYKREQTQRRLAEVLNRVGQALTGTLNLQEVLNQVLEQLHELVTYDRGALLLQQDEHLEFVAIRGDYADTNPLQTQIPINSDDHEDVFVRIYRSRQPVAIDDVPNYPGWQQVSSIATPKTWLGVPLLRHGEVVGMLSLARQEDIPYSSEDQTVAITFAAQAAIALENAKLYNQIKEFNAHLEDIVAERTEEVRQAYEQLERLDRTKSDFIAITAHELRTPITILKGYGQILGTDVNIQSNPNQKNLVDGIIVGSNRLLEIVNTMLIMVKLDSRALEIYPEPLAIMDVVETIALDLAEDIKDRHQTLTIEPNIHRLPPIEGDKEVLLRVVSNVIMNAIKYTPDGGQITVHGRTWSNHPRQEQPTDSIEVIISDTGIGIAPEAIELIFTKFYQTGDVATHSSGQTKFKGGGPGLGLAIARGIIEAHHGLLWAESPGHDEENCPGSDFHILLPLRQP